MGIRNGRINKWESQSVLTSQFGGGSSTDDVKSFGHWSDYVILVYW